MLSLTVAPLYIKAASRENLAETSDTPIKRTALDVTDLLASHLTGTERPHEWDEFTSVPIADPRLEGIRLRCVQLENEEPGVRVAELRSALRLLQHLQHIHHISYIVALDGFYKYSDGTVAPMAKEDFYEFA